jgi:hypothetical protein
MLPRWAALSEADRGAFSAAVVFLNKRLERKDTLEWALGLGPADVVKRLALLEVLDSPTGRDLPEPWRSAWRLIEESWKRPLDEAPTWHKLYSIGDWIVKGDRSGALIKDIVALVTPVLDVKISGQPAVRPRSVSDLLLLSLSSGEVVDPGEMHLGKIADHGFLIELGHELDAAVTRGLDIARRIGWEEAKGLWRIGGLNRVYFVPKAELPPEEHEPDEFHHGIAPSVKLLYATVFALANVSIDDALVFVRRWQNSTSIVHTRLWAASGRDGRMVSPSEIGRFLTECSEEFFWDLHTLPEIAELRALRFRDLNQQCQRKILRRLRRRPPRSKWPEAADRKRVDEARLYWVLRELRRLEIAGADLPQDQKAWLKNRLPQFPDLKQMSRVDEGFLGTSMARLVPPNPDNQYDLLRGTNRLAALEAGFAASRVGWDNDPAERASDWMNLPGRADSVLTDLETAPCAGQEYPRTWDRFGWAHRLPQGTAEVANEPNPETKALASRVLGLIARLPDATLYKSIEGLAAWLDAWIGQVKDAPDLATVWLRLWPIAADVTNAQQHPDENPNLNAVVQSLGDREPMDLDTYNTPAGKLVGSFLALCPSINPGDRPFESDSRLREMRDIVVSGTGRSGLIAKHRLIEHLPYFHLADPTWTREHLLAPLLADTPASVTLWRAVRRHRIRTELLKEIGAEMAERAADPRLGRETRQSLVWSLVIESLHALRENRPPAVSNARVQQMLRSVDDEARAHGANGLQRFVKDLSAGEPDKPSPDELFRAGPKPFLEQVWPQERSLATPGVARALADLPATAEGAFVEAVDAIERFLVPFECWSMIEYGLYGEVGGQPRLSKIDAPNPEAHFRLLDLTIGTAEGAVVPHDLPSALEQVRLVAPQLADTQRFRRLAALTRR